MQQRHSVHPAVAYVAPFVSFLVLRWLPVAPSLLAPLRLTLVIAVIAIFSRRIVGVRPLFIAGSFFLGIAVFAVWIAPDVLHPGYRDFWLFHNRITGAARSSLPPLLKTSAWFIAVRMAETAIVVPIVEELFWRGWLMRWLVDSDFQTVPLGRYTAFSFWAVALLFASEHGPYWDVGLLAGVAYNWWMVRRRSLIDCMLAHGVTNALLGAYVLLFDQWQYWM